RLPFLHLETVGEWGELIVDAREGVERLAKVYFPWRLGSTRLGGVSRFFPDQYCLLVGIDDKSRSRERPGEEGCLHAAADRRDVLDPRASLDEHFSLPHLHGRGSAGR